MLDVERGLLQPRIGRHDRRRHDRARVAQMVAVPVVGILAADAGQIRTGALGAPLERMIVHALGRQRIVAVAFHFVTQRAHHLRVAIVAALAHVDVVARQFERRIGTNPIHLLDRALQIEERHDFDQTAPRDGDDDADHQDDRVLLEDRVFLPEGGRLSCHWSYLLTRPAPARDVPKELPRPQAKRWSCRC